MIVPTEILAALIGATVAEHVAIIRWLRSIEKTANKADTRTQTLCKHVLGSDPAEESVSHAD